MRLDLSLISALMPMVRELKGEIPSSDEQWALISGQPGLTGVLENGFVREEDGRSLTFEEWKALWQGAATGLQAVPGFRQRYMLQNMQLALTHTSALEQLLVRLLRDEDSLSEEIVATVKINLPAQAQLPGAITLALGTCSGGFVDGEGGIFVDLATIHALADDPFAIIQFLAHETWHSGHWSLVATHPRQHEPWFGPLVQLQSEGMVNHLIGGTYELMSRTVQTDHGETRNSAARFLDYADTMDAHSQSRMVDYLEHLEALIAGNTAKYDAFVRNLPDNPGYLHGVLMAKTIEETLGRRALLETTPDPVAFLLTAIQAFQRANCDVCSPALWERFAALSL